MGEVGGKLPEFTPRALAFNSCKRTVDRALGPTQAEKEINQDPQRAAHRESPKLEKHLPMGEEGNRDLVHPRGVPPPPVTVRTASLARTRLGTDITWRSRIPKERKVYVSLLAFANTKPLWRHIVGPCHI